MRTFFRFAVWTATLFWSVFWIGSSSVPAKDAKSGQRRPERWAVLIGVDDYAYASDLKFCGKDMQALRDELVKVGFDDRQVLLLNDDAKEKRLQPYKSNIQKQIELICSNADRGDLVLIGFSGHGVHLNQVSYLCPTDAKPDDRESLISLDWVYEQLNKSPADLKLVMVDACRNEPIEQGGKRNFTAAERTAGSRAFVQEMDRLPRGILLVNSCAEGEFAQEDNELGHGVFMSFLLDGLRGKADKDRDKTVTIDEWFKYAAKETKLHVGKKFGASQNPRLKGNYDVELLDFEVASFSGNRPEVPVKLPPSKMMPNLAEKPVTSVPQIRPNHSLTKTSPKNFTNSIGMQFVLVPSGEFKMGISDDGADKLATEISISKGLFQNEQPQHKVTISKPYYLGMFEVTKEQFGRFVAEVNYQTESERDRSGGTGYDIKTKKINAERSSIYTWRHSGWASYDDSHPVVNVTWNDAREFCNWLTRKEGISYRLPTEAEWEYACRAGTTSWHPGGDDVVSLTRIANVADQNTKKLGVFSESFQFAPGDDGYPFTAPVGSFEANNFGLHDMVGNVWEWCEDAYDRKAYSARAAGVIDPSEISDGDFRVSRGGSWGSRIWDNSSFRRAPPRLNQASCNIGFRVCRN